MVVAVFDLLEKTAHVNLKATKGYRMTSKLEEAFLIGNKIYLRAVMPGDEEMISRIENHPDPRSTLFYAQPSTIQQIKEKVDAWVTDPTVIILTICRKEDDIAIGMTAFFRIDWVGRMTIFYIGIADKSNWSKGYGTEATKQMVEYAFNTLNLNRIQLHVAVENEPAVNVYKKVGFKIEGTLREAMYHNGVYSDFYVMGLLHRDVK
jgi:RimJ/RimL family protein N-acetyltransferase